MNAVAETEPYDSTFDIFENRKSRINNERTADWTFQTSVGGRNVT